MITEPDPLETKQKRFPTILIIMLIFLAGLFAFCLVSLAGLLLLSGTPPSAILNPWLGISVKTPWHLSRSAGTVAYLLLAGSTIWGLLLSSKIIKETVPASLALGMHNALSWLALALTGFHGLILLFDNYYTYDLASLAIPFIGPYRPGWVGLGIVGFYLMALVVLSFQFRKQIGQKTWRALHYLSFVAFVLATIHGLAAGTDSGKIGMQLMYMGSGLAVLFLTNYRLLFRQQRQLRQPQTTNG